MVQDLQKHSDQVWSLQLDSGKEVSMMILEMIVDSLGGKRYGQSLDGLTGRVGYVYPDNEESYYVHSDISEWRDIECVNGHFYAELQS